VLPAVVPVEAARAAATAGAPPSPPELALPEPSPSEGKQFAECGFILEFLESAVLSRPQRRERPAELSDALQESEAPLRAARPDGGQGAPRAIPATGGDFDRNLEECDPLAHLAALCIRAPLDPVCRVVLELRLGDEQFRSGSSTKS
jgi:hypothetical protein